MTGLEGQGSTIELHPQARRGSNAKRQGSLTVIGWWAEEDSNLRRLRRQIYSLLPLTARESAQWVVRQANGET